MTQRNSRSQATVTMTRKNLTFAGQRFNVLIEDSDLFREEDIGTEENDQSFTAIRNRNKLTAIKEVYIKFRSCLKGEARGTWLKLVEDQPALAANKYAVDNDFVVENFKDNQK